MVLGPGWLAGTVNGLEVPSEHYWNIGRVVVAASKLEVMAGSIVHAGTGDEVLDRSWIGVAGRVGAVKHGMERLIKLRPEDTDLAQFWADAVPLFAERGRLVHSIVELVFPDSDDDAFRAKSGTTLDWVLIHPGTEKESALPTREDVDDLVRRMNALSARAIGIGNRLWADVSGADDA